jgi:flagellar biosynthesis/type III secretory pathway protein FliH
VFLSSFKKYGGYLALLSLIGCDSPSVLVSSIKTLDFGPLFVSQSRTLQLDFKVEGEEDLKFEGIQVKGDEAFRLESGNGFCQQGKTYRAGASCQIAVTFQPMRVAEYAGEIYVRTQSDGESSSKTVGLKGRGIGPLRFEQGTVNFGEVKLTQEKRLSFKLVNISDEDITLHTIQTGDKGAVEKTSFYQDLSESTCREGGVINKGSSCLIQVAYVPQTFMAHQGRAEVTFSDSTGMRLSSRADLNGTATLDCQLNGELKAGYNAGTTRATTRMNEERLRGTNAGQALTELDGFNLTYRSAYDRSYRLSYDQSYQSAFVTSRDQGIRQGRNSLASCRDGDFEGEKDATFDGSEDGEEVGYADGYADGFARGDVEGYDVGFSDGFNRCYEDFVTYDFNRVDEPALNTCATSFDGRCDEGRNCAVGTDTSDCYYDYISRNGLENFPKPASSTFVGLCEERGFGATYDSSVYDSAFAAAKAGNANYQRGAVRGTERGQIEGSEKGTMDGASLGQNEGFAQGYREGEVIVFEECYVVAYEETYASVYENSFQAFYPVGFDAGYVDGYETAYLEGDAEGVAECQAIYSSKSGYKDLPRLSMLFKRHKDQMAPGMSVERRPSLTVLSQIRGKKSDFTQAGQKRLKTLFKAGQEKKGHIHTQALMKARGKMSTKKFPVVKKVRLN